MPAAISADKTREELEDWIRSNPSGFVDYVLGDGQQTLAEYGFLPPP